MTAEEIRKHCSNDTAALQEIAAQLAELNANIKVATEAISKISGQSVFERCPWRT